MSAVPAVPSIEPVLLRRNNDGVATLTLNRPRQYNALSAEVIAALDQAFDELARDTRPAWS